MDQAKNDEQRSTIFSNSKTSQDSGKNPRANQEDPTAVVDQYLNEQAGADEGLDLVEAELARQEAADREAGIE